MNSLNIGRRITRLVQDHLLPILICTGFLNICYSQTRCGSEYFQDNYLASGIDYNDQKAFPRAPFNVSIVFHVFTLAGDQPLDTSVFLNQIDILNDHYQPKAVNAASIYDELKTHIGSPNIQFCLASVNPNGNPTKGIIYYNTSNSNLANQIEENGERSIKHTSLGGIDAWDPNHYLNIWVIKRDLFLGDSSFPDIAGEQEDGIVIDADAVGANRNIDPKFSGGKTLVHEIGHYLGLNHLWANENGEKCNTDDGIDDTPTQEGPYLGCPSFPQESCGSLDFIYNFMDFSNDECLLFFTKEQVNVINHVLSTSRSGLSMATCSSYATESSLENIIVSVSENHLRFQSPNNFDKMDFNIVMFDIAGKRIMDLRVINNFTRDIEIHSLPSGIYVILLDNGLNRAARKIFIGKI